MIKIVVVIKKTYDFAYDTMNKLIDEIKSKTNKYINMNLKEML